MVRSVLRRAAFGRPHHAILRAGRGDERGSTPLQAAILAPAVLAITFGIVQGGLYYHERNVATSAAAVGVEAARVYGASGGVGRSAAVSYLSAVSPSLASGASVTASRGSTTATVRVSVPAPSLVPGLRLPAIQAQVSAAVERVTRP